MKSSNAIVYTTMNTYVQYKVNIRKVFFYNVHSYQTIQFLNVKNIILIYYLYDGN